MEEGRILSAGEGGYAYSIRKGLLLSVACKAMLEACGRATNLTEGEFQDDINVMSAAGFFWPAQIKMAAGEHSSCEA